MITNTITTLVLDRSDLIDDTHKPLDHYKLHDFKISQDDIYGHDIIMVVDNNHHHATYLLKNRYGDIGKVVLDYE
jgi:hypothetical protein